MGLHRVEGLFMAFAAVRAVDSVSFEVQPGEIYGLLGPNGAGKITTISMVSGLLKPDAGEVIMAGTPFWSDPQKAKRIMGVVPQELAFYEELYGRENLESWSRMAGLGPGEAQIRRRLVHPVTKLELVMGKVYGVMCCPPNRKGKRIFSDREIHKSSESPRLGNNERFRAFPVFRGSIPAAHEQNRRHRFGHDQLAGRHGG